MQSSQLSAYIRLFDPMAADSTEDNLKALKAWALPVVGGLLLSLLSFQVNSAVNEMKDTRIQMQQVLTDAKVATTRFEYMVERTKGLEDSRKEAQLIHQQLETRLSSLEQRAALYDQIIEGKK